MDFPKRLGITKRISYLCINKESIVTFTTKSLYLLSWNITFINIQD